MNILGRKAIGPISNEFGQKMKEGIITIGNKLVKIGIRKATHHIYEQVKKHYSPLKKR